MARVEQRRRSPQTREAGNKFWCFYFACAWAQHGAHDLRWRAPCFVAQAPAERGRGADDEGADEQRQGPSSARVAPALRVRLGALFGLLSRLSPAGARRRRAPVASAGDRPVRAGISFRGGTIVGRTGPTRHGQRDPRNFGGSLIGTLDRWPDPPGRQQRVDGEPSCCRRRMRPRGSAPAAPPATLEQPGRWCRRRREGQAQQAGDEQSRQRPGEEAVAVSRKKTSLVCRSPIWCRRPAG